MAVALQSSAGSNLSYLCDKILFNEDERDAEQAANVYSELDRIAAEVPAGARGLLYAPWLCGELSPVDDPSLRAGLLNMSLHHSRKDIVRAFLEGVALNTRWMTAAVSRFVGKTPDQITMVGGGATSDVWCQIFADVLGIPIRQLEAPIQANAIGAALIACLGVGALAFDDIPNLTQIHRTYLPDSDRKAVYDQAFENFTFAHRRLAPLYRRLNPHNENASMSFYQERRSVVSTCLELADKGYLAGTGGNVACRINDEYFAITPSATDYFAMCADDVCVLRLNDLAQTAGDRPPSVELRLHAQVLRIRRDCDAIIHTHQPIASAYTLLGRPLDVRDPRHRAMLGPTAPLVSYAPSGTSWLASKLGKTLRPGINAYLLRNHGVVCCGPTLDETVTRVATLEQACATFFRNAINEQNPSNPGSAWGEVLTLLAGSGKMEIAQ